VNRDVPGRSIHKVKHQTKSEVAPLLRKNQVRKNRLVYDVSFRKDAPGGKNLQSLSMSSGWGF